MIDLTQKAKLGASWLAVGQIIKPLLEFIIGMVLARILSPKDFGIVAMGMVFHSLAVAISNLGISNIIIQKKDLNKEFIHTAQSISILSGIFFYTILYLSSYFVNSFFTEPLAGKVLIIFSTSFIINSFSIIPSSLLVKEMKFKEISLIDISSAVVYGLTALSIAHTGAGLWSIVYAPIISILFSCICYCVIASYIPIIGWNNKFLREILCFGGSLTFSAILNHIARNIDFLIIGKFINSGQLGLYKKAYDLAVIPKEKVADLIGARIFFPFLCKINIDNLWMRSSFLKISRLIALICFPILIFSFISANDIIYFLYGKKWLGSVMCFKIISIGGILYALSVPFGSILLSKKMIRYYLFTQVIYLLTITSFSYIGINWGIEGVATGILCSSVVSSILNIILIKKILSLSFLNYMINLKTPALVSLFVIMPSVFINTFTNSEYNLLLFSLKFFTSLTVFVFFIFKSNNTDAAEIKKYITSTIAAVYSIFNNTVETTHYNPR